MKNIIKNGFNSINSIVDSALNDATHKFTLVREIINNLPIFISSERTNKYGVEKYDERHYFIVPFMLSETKIALHTMRCLPDGVPEINKLKKRRIFHFPNIHSELLIRDLLVNNATEMVLNSHSNDSNTLINLANAIDTLDKKLTYGMLFIGGLAAITNPVVGAGIAIKAILPSVTSLLTKYGVRPVGDKIKKSKLEKKIKAAEKSVLEDFEAASTIQVINPILQELELALRTTEKEHDPLLDFDLDADTIEELDGERWQELTETALYHVYKDIIKDAKKHKEACLGPEDIRWLKIMINEKER